MSIAGGVNRSLERGRSIGCTSVQIFVKNQLRWRAPPLREEEVRLFREGSGRFRAVFAHTCYLINLASPLRGIWRKSARGLAEELRRCRALGIGMLVMHPGAHMGRGVQEGIRRLALGAREAYEEAEAPEVTLLLEATAGRGTLLGGRFEELRDMLDSLAAGCEIRAGVCVDTCHLFSAGYELRDREGYERTMEKLELTIGLNSVRALHLNDSQGELGSGVDRHAHIGGGKIGIAGFRNLVRDRRFANLPAVLETPKGPEMREDVRNLSVLRGLRRA